jgi:serine/threonine protein kinase
MTSVPPAKREVSGLARPQWQQRHAPFADRFIRGRSIAVGGAATIYSGTDKESGRPVALKVSLNRHFNPRLSEEAGTLKALPEHENLISLIADGYDAVKDKYWIALPLIQGVSLAQKMKEGPLTFNESLKIFRQTADGLAAAADRGIFHKDLNPGNVLIDGSGKVKIIDFGLSTFDDTLKTVGTPGYLSPEQLKWGLKSDRRSDIYALGIILYEMVDDHNPFEVYRGQLSTFNMSVANMKGAGHELPAISHPLPEPCHSLTQALIDKLTDPRLEARCQTLQEVLEAAGEIERQLASFIAQIRREHQQLKIKP